MSLLINSFFHAFDNVDFQVVSPPFHVSNVRVDKMLHSEFFSVTVIIFWIYFILNSVLLKILPMSWLEGKTYKDLSHTAKLEWNSRIFSNINAAFLIVVLHGSYYFHYYEFSLTNVPRYTKIGLALDLAYFIHDSLLLWRVYGKDGLTNQKMMYFHHCAATLGPLMFMYMEGGPSVLHAVAAGTEISTFFLNKRWFMRKKNNMARYNIVNILFGVTFLIPRNMFTAYVFHHLFTDTIPVYHLFGPGVCLTFGIAMLGTAFMNSYWSFLIIQKIVGGSEKKKAPKEKVE